MIRKTTLTAYNWNDNGILFQFFFYWNHNAVSKNPNYKAIMTWKAVSEVI